MIRTIIVDDEILLRVGIQSLIDGQEDVSVTGVFENGSEALDFLQENPVDIVITDIEMAEMSGLELIRVIREKRLADGIIILSSHDNFSYAQEAISMGTDSYLLKHSVTRENLLKEIHKIYDKIKNTGLRAENVIEAANEGEKELKEGIYVVGVVRTYSGVSAAREDNMLVHLLDGIVRKYNLGTLFAPYNKELFILFTMEKDISEEELRKNMDSNILLINKNMRQYVNGRISYGLSTSFCDLKQMKGKYEEALEAIELSFYDTEKSCFVWQSSADLPEPVIFSTSDFLEKNGEEIFSSELNHFLNKALFEKANVKKLKEQLIQSVTLLLYQIMKECNVGEEFMHRWHSDTVLISDITRADSAECLKERVSTRIQKFRKEIYEELEKDDLAGVFSYIESNLKEKITLEDLTNVSCMSVPTFCRKFKERTGLTVVQYVNERRVEKAKILMKNQNYSLGEIAEMIGFSNANYLIRVFKKMTGQTVSEYRGLYEEKNV